MICKLSHDNWKRFTIQPSRDHDGFKRKAKTALKSITFGSTVKAAVEILTI